MEVAVLVSFPDSFVAVSGRMSCLTGVSLPQAIGSFGAGLIDIEELHKIERCALPGSGACGETITRLSHDCHMTVT